MTPVPAHWSAWRSRLAGRIDGLPARLAPAYAEGGADPFRDTGATYAALFPAGDPGYYGDPAASTVEAGERLLEKTADGLAGFYATFGSARLKVGEP